MFCRVKKKSKSKEEAIHDLDFRAHSAVDYRFVLGTTLFGLSVWVVLPKEASPFQDGFLAGLIKCAGFQVVMTILLAISIGAFGFYGIGVAIIAFLIGMNKVFGAGFVDSIMIVVANVALAEGLKFLLLKMV